MNSDLFFFVDLKNLKTLLATSSSTVATSVMDGFPFWASNTRAIASQTPVEETVHQSREAC